MEHSTSSSLSITHPLHCHALLSRGDLCLRANTILYYIEANRMVSRHTLPYPKLLGMYSLQVQVPQYLNTFHLERSQPPGGARGKVSFQFVYTVLILYSWKLVTTWLCNFVSKKWTAYLVTVSASLWCFLEFVLCTHISQQCYRLYTFELLGFFMYKHLVWMWTNYVSVSW